MLIVIFLLAIISGVASRRCQLSSNFQRYCYGKHTQFRDLTAEECVNKCNKDPNILVAHWHPGFQIWKKDRRSVCFAFRKDDKNLKVCPWGTGALIGANPGARMIRCSGRENNEIERCTSSNHFQRYCGNPVRVTYDESMERCRQRCNDNALCHVAHWHPPKQIWKTVDKPVCWMFPMGTKVCPWKGGELIGRHPGAQMFRCKEPTLVSFKYNLNAQKIIGNKPQVMGRTVVINNCPKVNHDRCPNQSKKISVSKTTESTKSWEHTVGVSITAGMTFSVGVPLVAEGEASLEVTASYDHTWGTTESQSKTWTVEDDCIAGAGMKVTCEFFVIKKSLHVPWTAVWSTGEKTQGVYKGVDFLFGGTTVTPVFLTKK